MQLIKPSVEIIKQGSSIEDMYKHITKCGYTCYKTEKEITESSAKAFVDRMIKSRHCYTGNSMVLTEIGWVSWNAYNGEKVAVVNTNGDFVGFETPKRVIKHSYTGNFYYYPSLGLEVTDGHRMYGLFREGNNDFYNSNMYDTFVCGQSYKDNNGRQKTLGERMFKVPKHCSKPIQTNPYYELVGFWLGDGCYQPQTINKLIFHLKKKRKIEYLKTLCKELGYTLEVGKNNYYKVCHPQIGAVFSQLFYYRGKHIPNMYKSSDAIAIKSIILGLINSDGSRGVNTKTITFTNTSLSIIQWLNNVAAIGGFTVSFRGVCHETSIHNPVYKILLLDTDYTINNDRRNPDSKVRIVNKTEDVYCVTVSTGLILVKGENGVTSICGNCAMLEHGTVTLAVPVVSIRNIKSTKDGISILLANTLWVRWFTKKIGKASCVIIITNYRFIVENNLQSFMEKYWYNMPEEEVYRVTAKIITDRGVTHELVRHRTFSYAMESSRYCNYSKDKFGNSITYIEPNWYNQASEGIQKAFEESLSTAESTYFNMLSAGYKPQDARNVLPNALKAEIIMTGFVDDWRHFFDLRHFDKTGPAHPDMHLVADPLYKLFSEIRTFKNTEVSN